MEDKIKSAPRKRSGYMRQYYKEHRGKGKHHSPLPDYGSECKSCGKILQKGDTIAGLCKKCYRREYCHERHRKLRAEMVEAYGGKCACCGETESVFLCLDHIYGGGTRERGRRGGGSIVFLIRLKKAGWPKGRYQLLCWNCNAAKAILGYCPHALTRS